MILLFFYGILFFRSEILIMNVLLMKGFLMVGWKRVPVCALCGQARCVVSVKNPRMAYCHRYQKIFFLSNDKRFSSIDLQKPKTSSQQIDQTFDFGDDHLSAIDA